MRIGMVAWSFYPRAGGSVTTVLQLSEAIIDKEVDVEIIAPLLKKDIPKTKNLDIDKRIKIHWIISSYARSYTDFYSRFIFFFKMGSKIRELSRNIDVFHAHDFNVGFFSAVIGSKKPMIGIFGADPLFEAINYKRRRPISYESILNNRIVICLQAAVRMLTAMLLRGRVIVVSPGQGLDDVIKRYFSGRIVHIPAGIDIKLYRGNKLQGERKSGRHIILVVARLVSWKGIDRAIEVFGKIKKHRKDVELLIIGDGPLREYYIRRYKDTEGIVFITNAGFRDVIGCYRKASVLLVTSQYDTFGITILEAMASGIPIVASDLPVFHDRIHNGLTGYLTKATDICGFCDRAIELIEDAEKSVRIISNAFEKAKAYDMDKISSEYIDVYKDLIGR